MISPYRGILAEQAPTWEVDEWFNLPEGKTKLEPSDFANKLIYLYCFQSWCAGCHSHGFPTLKAVQMNYQGANDVAFVAIQTVFEGFQVNTLEAAKEAAQKHQLDIPIGHDAPNGQRSKVMTQYHTGGTPWTVIIDKQGIVRFNGFHAQADKMIQLSMTLRNEQG